MRISTKPQYYVDYYDLNEEVRKEGFRVDVIYHLRNHKKPKRTLITAQDGQNIDDLIATLCEQEKVEKKQLLVVLVCGCEERA